MTGTMTSARDEQAAGRARYIDHMRRCVDDLRDGYARLGELIAAGSGTAPEAGSGGGRASRVAPPLPVRVEVIDAQVAVEALAARFVPLVRGTLRMGVSPRRPAVDDALRFLGSALLAVHDTDPVLGDELTDALWAARHDVRALTATGARPYRVAAPCPACGSASVWVSPGTWAVRCTACGDRTAVSASVLTASLTTSRHDVASTTTERTPPHGR